MKSLFLSLSLAFGLLYCFQLQAQVTITIYPQKDNTLYENEKGELSNGAGDHLFVGKTNLGLIRRALLRFDIASALPAKATITDVTLTLTMDQSVSGASQVEVHALTADWGEGASVAALNGGAGAPAQTGDATWLHTFYNTALWSKPGGDFNPVASAATAVNAVGSYSWTSAQLTAAVQQWLNEPLTNFGWCLTGDEANVRSAKRFASRENTNAANVPRLSITYQSPVGVKEATAAPRCSFVPLSAPGTWQLTVTEGSHPSLKIFNTMGKVVYAQSELQGSLLIDMHRQPAGIYIYQLLSHHQIVETGKIIIGK